MELELHKGRPENINQRIDTEAAVYNLLDELGIF